MTTRAADPSPIITSNLVFSEWDRIFKDPMTTAAAIDRLVHHSVILEMTGGSIRIEHAQAAQTTQGASPTTTTEPPNSPATIESMRFAFCDRRVLSHP